jgi:hypothetical protein
MANNTIQASKQNVVSGLGTQTYNIVTTGRHKIKVMSEVQPTSGISIVINQNGTPVATSPAPSAAQGVVTLLANVNCTAGDAITIVTSSSTAMDTALLNNIVTFISIYQGL